VARASIDAVLGRVEGGEVELSAVRRGREEDTSDFACREVETEEGERAVAMAEMPSFGWKTGVGVVTEVMICEGRSDLRSAVSENVVVRRYLARWPVLTSSHSSEGSTIRLRDLDGRRRWG
jgi:hypothetical protein